MAEARNLAEVKNATRSRMPEMPNDNFVERVHAYSKWLLCLDAGFENPSEVTSDERAKPAG